MRLRRPTFLCTLPILLLCAACAGRKAPPDPTIVREPAPVEVRLERIPIPPELLVCGPFSPPPYLSTGPLVGWSIDTYPPAALCASNMARIRELNAAALQKSGPK